MKARCLLFNQIFLDLVGSLGPDCDFRWESAYNRPHTYLGFVVRLRWADCRGVTGGGHDCRGFHGACL
jgi:hypothetical protein